MATKKLSTAEIQAMEAQARAEEARVNADNARAQSLNAQSALSAKQTQNASASSIAKAQAQVAQAQAEEERAKVAAQNAQAQAQATKTPTVSGTAQVNTASAGPVNNGTVNTQNGQTLQAPTSIADLLSKYMANYTPAPQRTFDFNKARDDYSASMGAVRDANKASNQAMYDSGIATQQQNYDNAMADINKQAEDSLRQAYISSMLNQRNLNSQLADAGISGGATETVMANLINNYQNNRNSIYDTQSNNIRDLNIANNSAREELYRTLLGANAQADNDYLKSVSDYERELGNMQFSADESDLSRWLQMRGQDINNYLSAASSDAGNQLDWNKVLNSNDQNAIDWINKFLSQTNDQNWQASQNDLDRKATEDKYKYEGALEVYLKQMGIDADLAKAAAKYATSGGSSSGSGNGTNDGVAVENSGVTNTDFNVPTGNGNGYSNAMSEAQGIYRNSNGDMNAVSNNLLTKIKNGAITSDDALNILGSVSSAEKTAISNAIREADAIYQNSGGNLTAVGNTIAGMVNSGKLSKAAATIIANKYY